ncbi:MAG TPA: sulfatase-like hydrolase/transferase [Ramlibacter sp.]|nr:sulfatase-like hydrolase/transferase [Ramlibacter sp.]
MNQDGAQRPNLIVIFNDDHGAWASGPYGNPDVRTPTLDHLARHGVVMANAFTPTPVCSPARASFWTGKTASQHGVHDFVAAGREYHMQDWLRGQPTLATILSRSGYRVGMLGKWHLGQDEQPHEGFDSWFTLSGDYPVTAAGAYRFSDNGRLVTVNGFKTHILTDKAVQFIRESSEDEPFLLFVGYTATHSPWAEQPERLVDSYRPFAHRNVLNRNFVNSYPFGVLARESLLPTRANPEEALSQYYAAVTHLDEGVARIVDELEETNQLRNTVVIYTSDHGLCFGQHGIYGKGNGTVPVNMLEDAIRIPMIFSGHHMLQGQRRAEFVDHLDLFATLLDCARVSREHWPTGLPGWSFRALLTNEPLRRPWRTVQFGEYGPTRMVRTATHKLVCRYPQGPDELFDLVADPQETVNLLQSGEAEGLRRELEARIDDYFAAIEEAHASGLRAAQVPWPNPAPPWALS